MSKRERSSFNFYNGPEKRIRHRLGLGNATSIGIDDLLRIAKIHDYHVELVNCTHWEFSGSKFYRIFTGESYIGTCMFYYDVGIDSKGLVTDIFEGHSLDPDYGIGRFLAYVFNYNNARDRRRAEWAERRRLSIQFPHNKEKKIRATLGLAETQQFVKTDLIELSSLHGYEVQHCDTSGGNLFNLNPVCSKLSKRKRKFFQMTVADNDKVESIIEVQPK